MLMIEDAKRDGPKKNVGEEWNKIPLDDLNTTSLNKLEYRIKFDATVFRFLVTYIGH